jgi:putative hemin transport protein
MTTMQVLDLKSRWQELKERSPRIRIRDAAQEIGVSEAELLATRLGDGVTLLQSDWKELIKEFPRLGRVMCLTRNEAAVHERYGVYENIEFFHGMGQVTGPDIDLRLFLGHWKIGFAVTDATPEADRLSFHFFDAQGTAVQKLYLTESSDTTVYEELKKKFAAPQGSALPVILPAPARQPGKPDAEVDLAAFHQAWLGMKDTHDFFMILQKFQLGREQALRLAPEGHATRLPIGTPRRLLEEASARDLPIMVFVGSAGCIQIHTGPVKNIRMFGDDWVNVLDDEFNLHLRLPLVESAWMVRKPTTDGDVTSVELYDAQGENLVLFFGKRKPGNPEDERWRQLVRDLQEAK